MDNFDLRKYLSNNILLEKKLTDREQKIVDDILDVAYGDVTESKKEALEKMKKYARKGLLTVAIISTVCSTIGCQKDEIEPIYQQTQSQAQDPMNVVGTWKGTLEVSITDATDEGDYNPRTGEGWEKETLENYKGAGEITISNRYGTYQVSLKTPGGYKNPGTWNPYGYSLEVVDHDKFGPEARIDKKDYTTSDYGYLVRGSDKIVFYYLHNQFQSNYRVKIKFQHNF